MAKGIVYISDVDSIIADFDRTVADIEQAARGSMKKSLSRIESQMKVNAQSMLNKGYSKGRMVNAIGYHVGETYDGIITGSVGVYDDNIRDPKRRLTPPPLARMIENGTRPHSTSSNSRLKHKSRRGEDKGQEERIHGGSPPIPFLSSAFDVGSVSIFEDLKAALNNSISK
tara:strand:- start:33791 stop:34303 length:513 start_codon:yes stop_codon:yes gene_type:complete